jgi:hypothetical protein
LPKEVRRSELQVEPLKCKGAPDNDKDLIMTEFFMTIAICFAAMGALLGMIDGMLSQ